MRMWNKKWQWNSQKPGLSALNLSTTYPLFGTAIVSLAGGKLNCLWSKPCLSRSRACFRLIFFTFLSGDLPIPITLKEYPWRWKGWLRFGCWTEKKATIREICQETDALIIIVVLMILPILHALKNFGYNTQMALTLLYSLRINS